MTDKGSAVLYTLFGVAKAHGKGYCYPTQKHIMYLTRKYEKVAMSRATLNRVLNKLVDEGYVERVRRHVKRQDGSLWLRSTLYILKRKAYKFLGVLKNFLCRILGPFAVSKVRQYSSLREKEILKKLPPNVEYLLITEEKGRASPVEEF
jgi:DNA-binding MarR family transcriptional regulator